MDDECEKKNRKKDIFRNIIFIDKGRVKFFIFANTTHTRNQ